MPVDRNDTELRAARRGRVFAAMTEAEVDVLILGRRDSVAYATGLRSLWTAGTRPFGAACVLVAATGETHLLSSWDAGVPDEVPFDQLYGITWNPATMATALQAIDGLRTATRIGVDALSPGFARAAPRLAPGATLVPADELMHAVRAVKLPAEVERMRDAVAVARCGVEAATTAVTGGAELVGAEAAALRALAACGATVPTSAPVVELDPTSTLLRVDLGVLVDGYEGGLGRTIPLKGLVPVPPDAAVGVGHALLAACRPGATGRDLRAVAGSACRWMVRGSGMGFEPPVITATLGQEAVLEEGAVVSVEVDRSGWRHRELVLVGPDGATPL